MRALRAAYGPHPGRVPCLIQGRAFRDRVAQVARKERFAQPGPILLNRIEVWAARRDVPHAHPGIGVRLLAPCCGQEAFIVAYRMLYDGRHELYRKACMRQNPERPRQEEKHTHQEDKSLGLLREYGTNCGSTMRKAKKEVVR